MLLSESKGFKYNTYIYLLKTLAYVFLLQQCRTGTYHGHPRCDKFYVCVNNMLIAQSCAPGLVWRVDRSQCDFPTANSCSDRNHDSEPMSDASHTHDHSAPMMQLSKLNN